MRKKSHVSLAKYLLDNIDSDLLDSHRKAFIIGSILPDCKPSFLTTKHNINETFGMVCNFIRDLTEDSVCQFKSVSTAYCRRLGEVTHYLADYFTFPHNDIFTGTLKEHCEYEKQLKFELRRYISSEEIVHDKNEILKFTTPAQLITYVSAIHENYLQCKKTVESDCRYIVFLCYSVVVGVLNLLKQMRCSVASA